MYKTYWLSLLPLFSQVLCAIFFVIAAVVTEISFFGKIQRFSFVRDTFDLKSDRRKKRSPTLDTLDGHNEPVFTEEGDISQSYIDKSFHRISVSRSVACCRLNDKKMNLYWYHKLLWIVYDTAITLNIALTVYAMAIAPDVTVFSNNFEKVHIYGITTLLILIDFTMNSIPFRILHVVYPLIVCTVYFILSLIMWKTQGTSVKIIPEMNCTSGQCVEHIAACLGLGVPVTHIVLCGLHCLKGALAQLITRVKYRTRSIPKVKLENGKSCKIFITGEHDRNENITNV